MLHPDFSDMLSALSDAGAEFLVVGAHALAAHGAPRATGDLDVWVRPTPENAERVLHALVAFGAPMQNLSAADFFRPDHVVQIGVEPVRVDLLTAIEAVAFDEAWAERETAEVGGLSLPVLSRRHLIQNKRATGRPQDRADVERLERGRR